MLHTRPHTRFKRRLFLTGLGLFVIMLVMVVTGLVALQQHSLLLERSAAAHRVYASYRAVSDHTYRKLSAMAEIVTTGSSLDIDERYRNQQALRVALRSVKQNIDAELELHSDGSFGSTLQLYDEIESLAENIMRLSESIQQSTLEQDHAQASLALNQLRYQSVEGAFNLRIDRALAEQLEHVQQTEQQAAELTAKTLGFGLLVLLALSAFGALLMVSTWRALSQSLSAFNVAIKAYREGNFEHRIEYVGEVEFSNLAHALNGMAHEVATQRERERLSQEDLENQISARTRELEQSNLKLEDVSERRRQFLADISHELRTPLTVIRGEADVALRGGVKTVEQYEDALTRIREQSVHTARLVNDLLFVARTEVGQAPLHFRAEAMVPLVGEVCADLRNVAEARAVSIEEAYRDSELVSLVDAGRIKQVIAILIDNAIKYSHHGGQVRVSLVAESNDVVLHVIDDGIGLSAEQRANAFVRFYRANDGVNSPVGSGLGLPVAKAIVEAHRGRITLTSEQNLGTTATVILPLETQLKAVS